MLTPRSAACRRGQWTLIGTLVAVVIVIVLAAMWIPRLTRHRTDPGRPASAPLERADEMACLSYQQQINQAITLYKMDNEGALPRSVNDLKKYGITDEMLHAPGCALLVPGATAPGQAPAPSAPSPAGQRGPGGVTIPNIPGAGAGNNGGDTGE